MPRYKSTVTTLHHIAEKLKLSISTVSRALRNADGINPETRSLVIKTAEELGYDFSSRENSGNLANHHSILALAQCIWRQSDQRFLAGMSRASISLNLSILSHQVAIDECHRILDPKHQPPAMKSHRVDGIVLIHRWPLEIAQVLSERWPIVSIAHEYPDSKIDVVATESRNGMLSLVKHLKESGHEKIGFFGFCPDMTWANTRFSGFVEAQVRLGLYFRQEDIIPISLAEASSYETFPVGIWINQVIEKMQQGITAWVCSSDVVGLSLTQCLQDRGYNLPKDVAVTGFHKRFDNQTSGIQLTSVTVPDEDIGATALRQLLYRITHPEETSKMILLPTKFCKGTTT